MIHKGDLARAAADLLRWRMQMNIAGRFETGRNWGHLSGRPRAIVDVADCFAVVPPLSNAAAPENNDLWKKTSDSTRRWSSTAVPWAGLLDLFQRETAGRS